MPEDILLVIFDIIVQKKLLKIRLFSKIIFAAINKKNLRKD